MILFRYLRGLGWCPGVPKSREGGPFDYENSFLIICEKYHIAALDHIVSCHHINFGDNWTHSLGARVFAAEHKC